MRESSESKPKTNGTNRDAISPDVGKTINLTSATEAKTNAIRRALPLNRSADLPQLLAMLTSANKDEREKAKRHVRQLIYTGQAVIGAEKNAAALASFANRHEP